MNEDHVYNFLAKRVGAARILAPAFREDEAAIDVIRGARLLLEGLPLRHKLVAVPARQDLATVARLLAVLAQGGVAAPFGAERDAAEVRAAVDQVLDDHAEAKLAFLSRAAARMSPETKGHANDPAVVLWTSGTTGSPKGVTLTHANLISNVLAVSTVVDMGPGDRLAIPLPLQYSFGLSMMLLSLSCGTDAALLQPLLFSADFLDACEESGATFVAGVPRHFKTLLDDRGFEPGRLPRLRGFLQAGGPMPIELTRRLKERFPGADIYLMYGQTEAGPRVSVLPPNRVARKPGSVGPAIPGTTVTLRDEQGRVLPPGETGEIYVQGPGVMAGYWKNDAATSAVKSEAGLRTGDIGCFDDEGDLFISGRSSDLVKIGGERISARAIEDVVEGVPDVAGCVAQVGRRADEVDDSVRVLIVCASEEPGELVSRVARVLRSQFRRALVPAVVAVTALPTTPTGKAVRSFDPSAPYQGLSLDVR